MRVDEKILFLDPVIKENIILKKKNKQYSFFKEQIKLAQEFNLPFIIHNRESKNDVFNIRAPVPDKKLPRPDNFGQPIPSGDNFGRVAPINQLSNQMNEDRMNPEILSAFKSNPYAHSLHSY